MSETVTITLKFSTLQIVGAALREIPYKLAVGVIKEIEAEVQKSLDAAHEKGLQEKADAAKDYVEGK